jgi:hypothetical protein
MWWDERARITGRQHLCEREGSQQDNGDACAEQGRWSENVHTSASESRTVDTIDPEWSDHYGGQVYRNSGTSGK